MFADKQTALEEYIQDHANMANLQVVFENAPTPAADLFTEFLRFTVQYGDSKRMQIGGNGYRYFGVIMTQIFLKEGIGVARGVELADLVSSMLRDQVVSGVNLWVPFVTKIPFTEKGWFQVQVTTPFYFDEVN